MSYTINPNAKNKWARNAENTMDLSLETDASSVYLDNGRTLEQEIGEGSMVSNVATVDSAISKIIDGTLNGAYESGVMYGKTMVNGLSNPKIQQGREYITMVSPTHLIINHGENLSEKKINVNYDWFGGKMEDGADYTLDIWILKNTMHRKTDPKATIGKFNFNSYNTGFYGIPANTLGHITYEVTTSNVNTGGKPYIETFTSCEGELEIQIVIRQGKNLTPIEQHFEGICDVKMPILRNTGKNLLNPQSITYTLSHTSTEIRMKNSLKPNVKYTISFDRNGISWAGRSFYVKGEGFSSYRGTTDYDSKRAGITFSLTDEEVNVLNNDDKSFIQLYSVLVTSESLRPTNIQIEESPTQTTYEDHKTNILRTSEEIVLREVNEVQDTYNPLTGEYVRRIGEVVLDGSNDEEYIQSNLSLNNTIPFGIVLYDIKPKGASINNKFITSAANDNSDYEHSYSSRYQNKNLVWFFINKGKLSSFDVSGFRQWLSQNTITLQYELNTPIINTVGLSGYPFAYENGHIVLESGYKGQSLLPTLEYSTVINRTGQIQSIANTIQKQEKQLTMLEKMLIQNIINLDYNNTLLTLKNEMEEML